MSINNPKQRRAHAITLFEIEEREQQLAAIAIRHARAAGGDSVAKAGGESPGKGVGLEAIDRASSESILQAHVQLRSAREQAAQMAAADPELARLHALIDGASASPGTPGRKVVEPDVVDAEVIEAAKVEAGSQQPRLNRQG